MALKSSNNRIISGVRQKRARRKFLTWILTIVVIAGVIYLIYGEPLRISAMNIEGNKHTSTEDIAKIEREYLEAHRFFILPQNNIVFFSSRKFKRAVMEQVPGVASIELDGMKNIVVKISDRRATGIWCNDTLLEECYFFDDTGVVFKKSFDFIGYVFAKWYGVGMTTQIGETVGCVPACTNQKYIPFLLAHKIESIEYGVDTQRLQSLNNYVIKASNNATTTMNHMKTLELKKVNLTQIQYVDVRFPHKIYYK
ncbi:MAG: hypothetical protein RJB39_700 [Candidatus Parcubacteria bacterium]|jgi:hypothetical protein